MHRVSKMSCKSLKANFIYWEANRVSLDYTHRLAVCAHFERHLPRSLWTMVLQTSESVYHLNLWKTVPKKSLFKRSYQEADLSNAWHGAPVFASYIFEQPRSHHTSHTSQILASVKNISDVRLVWNLAHRHSSSVSTHWCQEIGKLSM